jgi:hypothetical protein
VSILLQHGADKSLRSHLGETALHTALRLRLQSGTQPNTARSPQFSATVRCRVPTYAGFEFSDAYSKSVRTARRVLRFGLLAHLGPDLAAPSLLGMQRFSLARVCRVPCAVCRVRCEAAVSYSLDHINVNTLEGRFQQFGLSDVARGRGKKLHQERLAA